MMVELLQATDHALFALLGVHVEGGLLGLIGLEGNIVVILGS